MSNSIRSVIILVAAVIMYGIAGGTGPANFYRINLTTGAVTVIGSTGIQAGSLRFGSSGTLFAGGTGPEAGNLYSINPSNGAATLVGNTGLASVTGLALVPFRPVPATSPLALLSIAGALLLFGLTALRLRRRA